MAPSQRLLIKCYGRFNCGLFDAFRLSSQLTRVIGFDYSQYSAFRINTCGKKRVGLNPVNRNPEAIQVFSEMLNQESVTRREEDL